MSLIKFSKLSHVIMISQLKYSKHTSNKNKQNIWQEHGMKGPKYGTKYQVLIKQLSFNNQLIRGYHLHLFQQLINAMTRL